MKTIKTINGIEQLLDKCFEEGITNNNEIAEILYNQLVVVPKEKILCAANYYNDCQTYKNQPINISKGFVICGYRHNHVNSIIEKISFLSKASPPVILILGTPISAISSKRLNHSLVDNSLKKSFL